MPLILVSCERCGVVLDVERLQFPDDIFFSGSIEIDRKKAAWNEATSEHEPFVPCPVCGEPIFNSSGKEPRFDE